MRNLDGYLNKVLELVANSFEPELPNNSDNENELFEAPLDFEAPLVLELFEAPLEFEPFEAPLNFEENMRLLMRLTEPDAPDAATDEWDDEGSAAAAERHLDLGAEFTTPDVLSVVSEATNALRLGQLLPRASDVAVAANVRTTLRSRQFAQVVNQFVSNLEHLGPALLEFGWPADLVATAQAGIQSLFQALESAASSLLQDRQNDSHAE